jgi:hypothetical protein
MKTPQELKAMGDSLAKEIGANVDLFCMLYPFARREDATHNVLAKMAGERLYHVFAVNEKTGRTVQCTGYPDTHQHAVTIKSRFTPHKDIRLELREAVLTFK